MKCVCYLRGWNGDKSLLLYVKYGDIWQTHKFEPVWTKVENIYFLLDYVPLLSEEKK